MPAITFNIGLAPDGFPGRATHGGATQGRRAASGGSLVRGRHGTAADPKVGEGVGIVTNVAAEIHTLGVAEMAAAVADGSITPLELAEALLARIR